jgi:ribonuclease P protein component
MDGSASGGGRPRRRRLARSAEFERVYRRGRSKANRFLVLYAFPREEGDDEGPRLGLSVSRRVGGAVDRTRVKRVLREAFWQEAERLPDGADYVVVARPDAKPLAEREGTAGVRRVLGELVESMGGSPAASTGPSSAPDPNAAPDAAPEPEDEA